MLRCIVASDSKTVRVTDGDALLKRIRAELQNRTRERRICDVNFRQTFGEGPNLPKLTDARIAGWALGLLYERIHAAPAGDTGIPEIDLLPVVLGAVVGGQPGAVYTLDRRCRIVEIESRG